MAPEHRDCISDLHTVIAARIVTKRKTHGLTSVGADSVDNGINSVTVHSFLLIPSKECRQVNIVVASVDGHMADGQVRTSSKVARGTPKWRSS